MIRRCGFISPFYILNELLKRKEKNWFKGRRGIKTHAGEADLIVKPKNHEHRAKINTSVMNLQCILSNTVPLSQLFVLKKLVKEFENCRFTSTCTCRSSLLHIAQHWVTKPHKNVKMNTFTQSHSAIWGALQYGVLCKK